MEVIYLSPINPRRFLDFQDLEGKIRQESTQIRRSGLNLPWGRGAIIVEKAVRLSSHQRTEPK